VHVLGVSAFGHDSAAALVVDGTVVAAAQEERFSRRKNDPRFPRQAIDYCLTVAGVPLHHIDLVAFSDDPLLEFDRLLKTTLQFAPHGYQAFRTAAPAALNESLPSKLTLQWNLKNISQYIDSNRIIFIDNHRGHAASAFYPSPFDEAVILTIEGVGEWATTSLALGRGREIDIIKEIRFPHSLGMLYSAFTSYIGFKVNSGEYKVMGLAPYGEPKYARLILDHLIDLKDDGSFRLDPSYFDFRADVGLPNARFDALFGGPPREPEQPLTQRDMDLAASIQAVTEEAVLRLTRSVADENRSRNLCLAGSVALNCVANGKVLRDGRFDGIWIQPAAGDAGAALGAALYAYHHVRGQPRRAQQAADGMSGSFLGPAFPQAEIERRLAALGAVFEVLDDHALMIRTVDALCDGKAVGWFQGRMEFGPRALGARSILGDARSPTMREVLNLKVKNREPFRPFAPAILREDVADWFELDADSPYMLFVADVAEAHRRDLSEEENALTGLDKLKARRSHIPAVTHVDDSARVQTVDAETNPRFHALLTAFKARTGCPVLVNTSFNVRGEPIVCTPEDAFRCFVGTGIDVLVAGNCVLRKEDQSP